MREGTEDEIRWMDTNLRDSARNGFARGRPNAARSVGHRLESEQLELERLDFERLDFERLELALALGEQQQDLQPQRPERFG
jgi:hypothetical protein